jgi:hypothetical protein
MRTRAERRACVERRELWTLPEPRRVHVLERGPRCVRWRTLLAARGGPLRRSALGALLALGLSATAARAVFDAPLMTPQASAMGGASLASTADSATLFLNPAAPAGLAGAECYFAYDQIYAGLSGVGAISQSFAAVGAPTRLGTLTAGYGDFSGAGLIEERIAGVGFARRLLDGLDVGVTGKYLYEDYQIGGDALAQSDPVFQNGSARGAFSLDAGVIASLGGAWKLGLAVRNINQPNLGLSSVDRVPREIQAGLSYDVASAGLRLTADYLYEDEPAGSVLERDVPSLGLEKGFVDGRVKFRVGVTPDQLSSGVGIRFGPIDFDYAFILSLGLAENNAGTHQVGLRWRFGGSDAPRLASAAPPEPAVPVAAAPAPAPAPALAPVAATAPAAAPAPVVVPPLPTIQGD